LNYSSCFKEECLHLILVEMLKYVMGKRVLKETVLKRKRLGEVT